MPPKSQMVKRAMVGMGEAKVDEVSECRERGYLLTTKKIGSGSFSKVYLGVPTQEKIGCNFRLAVGLRRKRDNMVAIKIIPISQTLQHQSRRCLSREINALQTTYKHPNVIQLYETFRSPSRLYLVLELASQGDLLEHINRISDKKMALGLHEGEAKQLFHQLVGAVSHCHNKHIVHRDLKCENILLDETGSVKLTDFGLATRCRKNGLMSTFCGSMPYTAPEILQGQKYKGEHADIWSMGVILYAMVTGKLPFTEFQPSKLLEEIKSGVLYHEHLSTACQDLISKMLKWNPTTRLALSDILQHPWMLPAASFLFQKVRVFMAASSEKKQQKDTTVKGGDHLARRSPKGKKILLICDPSMSKLKLKMAAARQVSPGNGSPQEMLICPPKHKPPPSSADKPIKLFTRVPRPPTAAKPARSFKRPMSASLQNPGLTGKLLGSQEGLRCVRLSKSSQRINPTEQYLPRRLKGF
ncbi:testis-specific serine/threonine-protein kinase 5-like isoform X1 [Scyliorhinus canicula]|uniref:testis-specific serine/threonine-protein kinase 5-like isoform X1 n=1 Tax=Scyliorhinus canicula TaxID=7830 RepID=UPI0018F43B09|nr:testis-specific serine/threonine-protein kinase 5-like isoform X1 [Scyliorhinus canicula]